MFYSELLVYQRVCGGPTKCSSKQGLVTVPFWEYWTSPYSSHLVDHIPFMVGWCDPWGHQSWPMVKQWKDAPQWRMFCFLPWIHQIQMKAVLRRDYWPSAPNVPTVLGIRWPGNLPFGKLTCWPCQVGFGRLVSIKNMLFSGSMFIYQRVQGGVSQFKVWKKSLPFSLWRYHTYLA